MRVTFRVTKEVSRIDEKTYTIGGVQYWKRSGKCYRWTEADGRSEISDDEYIKAITSSDVKSTSSTKDVSKKVEPKHVEAPKDYKKAPAEDLAVLANQGDKTAEEEVITRYQPLIHKIANKYFIHGGDHDDLVQDGNIAVWEAIKGYDPSRNNDFTKFLSMAIDNRMKVSVRDDNTGKASVLNQASSMDVAANGGDGGDDEGRTLGETLPSKGPSIEDDYLGREGAEKLTNFMRGLPDKEREAIFRLVSGMKPAEIAEDMGVSYKTVENAIMRARNKIREFKAMNESRKLTESQHDDDLDESSFDYDGYTYTSKWGNYYKGKDQITQEEYHQAADLFKQSNPETDNVFTKASVDTITRMDTLKEFLKGLSFDTSYEIARDTRPHLPKIDPDDVDARIASIKSDIKCDDEKAKLINTAISNYTRTDQSKLTDAETYAINEYLCEAPVYNTIPLYRGMGFMDAFQDQVAAYESFKGMEPGDYLKLRGITSASSNMDVATNFSDANGEKYVIIVITKNLSAVSIEHLCASRYNEGECLYMVDAPLMVIKKMLTNDTVYLQVEEQDTQVITEDISQGAHVVDMNVGRTLHPKT